MVECAALERLCTSNRTAGSNPALSANIKGEVPEWLNGALSKSVVRFSRTAGSNPALSANIQEVMRFRFVSPKFSHTVVSPF